MLSGDPARSSKIYLAIGTLSLVKAIAVRDDRERFRRELLDAGLFLGVGLALRRYSTLKEEKRQELTEGLPDWLAGDAETGADGLAAAARRQFASESEPEPTLAERAKGVVGAR